MLESRIKIKYGKEKELSSQLPLQCNFMNEGCNGGWGMLSGFFLEAYYTTDEECAPYTAETKSNGCQAYAHCPAVARASETYYIGGAYG